MEKSVTAHVGANPTRRVVAIEWKAAGSGKQLAAKYLAQQMLEFPASEAGAAESWTHQGNAYFAIDGRQITGITECQVLVRPRRPDLSWIKGAEEGVSPAPSTPTLR